MEVLPSSEVRTVTGKEGDILLLYLLPDFLEFLLPVMLLNQCTEDIPAPFRIDDVYVSVEFKLAVLHATSRADYMLVSFNSNGKHYTSLTKKPHP